MWASLTAALWHTTPNNGTPTLRLQSRSSYHSVRNTLLLFWQPSAFSICCSKRKVEIDMLDSDSQTRGKKLVLL